MVSKLSDLNLFRRSTITIQIQSVFSSKFLMATCLAGVVPLPGQTPVPQATRTLQDDSFYTMALKLRIRQGDCEGWREQKLSRKPMCEDALDLRMVCSSTRACSLTSVLCSFSLFVALLVCGFVRFVFWFVVYVLLSFNFDVVFREFRSVSLLSGGFNPSEKLFIWGNVPIWLIFFRWVEATTEISIQWWQACTGDLPRYNSLAYGLFWSPTAWSQYSHDQGSNGDRNWDHTWPWHPSLPWNRIRICSIPFLHVLRSPRVLFHDGWLQFTKVSEMSVMISDSQVFKDSKHISTSQLVVFGQQVTMGQLGEWSRLKTAMKKAVRSVRCLGPNRSMTGWITVAP